MSQVSSGDLQGLDVIIDEAAGLVDGATELAVDRRRGVEFSHTLHSALFVSSIPFAV
jgi:hypothetical protein